MAVEKIRWLGVTELTVLLLAAAVQPTLAWGALPAPPDPMPESATSAPAQPPAEAPSPTLLLAASVSEGVSTLSDSTGTGVTSNGTQTELMLLGSLEFSNWILEGGGGWFLSNIGGQGASSASALQSYSLSTAAGVAELSPQYRLTDRLQIGPVGEALFGTDVGFGETLGSGTQDLAFLGGAQALYEFRVGAASIKLGARYLASLDLAGETLQSIQATLQLGLPIF